MFCSRRTCRAVVALILTGWTQACTAYRAPPDTGELPPNGRIRVQSEMPFPLSSPTAPNGDVLCYATMVQGPVRREAADTIVMELFGTVTSAAAPDGTLRACPTRGEVVVVRTTANHLTLNKVDGTSTAIVFVVIVAAIIGFVAYAASHIPLGSSAGWGNPGAPLP